ncbi:hypothetical protein GJAV_G00105530 [Gymnothorax javanicus]|nr:hypothetical protein GJAV_G00105530 [Gymnothorax javanicus]
MNRILFGTFAVGMLFAVGQALQCYYCAIGLGKLCITSEVTCKEGEQCFSGTGEAVGFVPVKMKGCLATKDCNQVDMVSLGDNSTTLYAMNKTCCAVDLCNSAPSLTAPSLFPVTMATFCASLLMSRTLV